MNFTIEAHKHYHLIDFKGIVDKTAILESYAALLQSEGFSKTSNSLWDCRKSAIDLSYKDIKEIASMVSKASDQRSYDSKGAFVVIEASDSLLLRTYITETAHYPVEFRLFKSLTEAELWLAE